LCVLRPPLKTSAALGLSQLLIDEGPQMLRLAHDAASNTEDAMPDGMSSANIRDFVLKLADTSSNVC
jgi:serine/threonine-protein kinase PknK